LHGRNKLDVSDATEGEIANAVCYETSLKQLSILTSYSIICSLWITFNGLIGDICKGLILFGDYTFRTNLAWN
jgi:hypothetical protein